MGVLLQTHSHSAATLPLALLALLLALPAPAWADDAVVSTGLLGSCLLWNETIMPSCHPYLSYQYETRQLARTVFLPAGTTVADLQATFNKLYRPAVHTLKKYCRHTLLALGCLDIFHPCVEQDPVGPLPLLVCRTMCEAANGECQSATSGQVPMHINVDCGADNPLLPNFPLFLESNLTVPLAALNATVEITCIGDGNVPTGFPPPEGCLDPHLFGYTRELDNCQPWCRRQTVFTHAERMTFEWIRGIGCTLNMIALLIVLLPHILVDQAREFPKNLSTFFGSVYFCFLAAFLVSFRGDPLRYTCHDDFLFTDKEDSNLCLAQGYLVVFFGTVITCMWAVITFNLFVRVVHPLPLDRNLQIPLIVASHCVSWLPAVYLLIQGTVTHSISSMSTFDFCLWGSLPKEELLPLLIVWTCAFTLGLVCLLSASIALIYKRTLFLGKSGITRTIRERRRLYIVCLFFTATIGYFLAFLWFFFSRVELLDDDVRTYVDCIVQANTVDTGCKFDPELNFPMTVLFHLDMMVLFPLAYVVMFSGAPFVGEFYKNLVGRGQVMTKFSMETAVGGSAGTAVGSSGRSGGLRSS